MIAFKLLLLGAAVILNFESTDALDWKQYNQGQFIQNGVEPACVKYELNDFKDGMFKVKRVIVELKFDDPLEFKFFEKANDKPEKGHIKKKNGKDDRCVHVCFEKGQERLSKKLGEVYTHINAALVHQEIAQGHH